MAGAGYRLFNTGDVLTAAQVNTYLQQQVIMVFASSAARSSALTGVLAEGMFTYLLDTNAFQYYDGAAFVDVSNPGDITGVTVTAPVTGGGTSGSVGIGISAASTSASGAVQLSDSTSTTSSVLASTPTATKAAYDLADGAIAKTTVTTAGDIIYRNATVPTRLGIGTAGQVLKVNSGATAPEWVTLAAASSGVTFIQRTTFSNTAEVILDNLFTSTYDTYIVVIENLTASTGADDAQMKMRRNGTTSSTSGIYGASVGASYNTNPANLGTTNAAAFNMAEYCDGFNATFYFNNVGTGTSIASWARGTYSSPSTGNAGTLGFVCADVQNWNGFTLKSSSSNVTGAVTIYGMAKA